MKRFLLIILSVGIVYSINLFLRVNEIEPVITLRGKLKLKEFPDSIEYDDRTNYWIVELDAPSFLLALNEPENELSLDLSEILKRKNASDLTLCFDQNQLEFFQQFQDRGVTVTGNLFHAHTAHHYTPLLLSLEQIELCD